MSRRSAAVALFLAVSVSTTPAVALVCTVFAALLALAIAFGRKAEAHA